MKKNAFFILFALACFQLTANASTAITTNSITIEKTEHSNPILDIKTLEVGQIIQLTQVHFEADAFIVNENAKPSLNKLAQFLMDHPNVSIEIGGHTNAIPPSDYCEQLSTQRAQAILNYLVTNGVKEENVSAKGYGKSRPIDLNTTAEGRKANQRVEIKILAID